MLIPTIHFPDNCDEAITFYKKVLGAKVKAIAYAKDAPPGSGMEDCPPHFVMYSELEILGSIISITDGGEAPLTSDSYSFMISFDTDEETAAKSSNPWRRNFGRRYMDIYKTALVWAGKL